MLWYSCATRNVNVTATRTLATESSATGIRMPLKRGYQRTISIRCVQNGGDFERRPSTRTSDPEG
jgi:hypothetical protein